MEGSRNSEVLKKIWIFPVLSGVFHFAFLCSQIESFKNDFPKSEKTQSQILIKLKSKNQQVVESIKSNENLAPKENSYLGKTNNTFSRQTRAKEIASFRPAGLGQITGVDKASKSRKSSNTAKKIKKINFSDLAITPRPREKNLNKANTQKKLIAKGLKSGERTKSGLSSSSDFLEDVPLGDFTKLNTQEFKFYGFYHRIRQKLEQFWGANLQEEMERIYKSGRSIASGKNFLTSLVIKMNSKGEIVKIQLNSTSGIQELDDIAISSFNEAGPFPNPPKNMLKDGVATIKWGFAVTSN